MSHDPAFTSETETAPDLSNVDRCPCCGTLTASEFAIAATVDSTGQRFVGILLQDNEGAIFAQLFVPAEQAESIAQAIQHCAEFKGRH